MKKLILTLLLFSTLAAGDVKNPVAFIGQAVLGSTPGAPLAADSNSQLVSGLGTVEVSGTSYTCNTSDNVITSITTSPSLAGTYLATFNGDVNSATGGVVVTLSYFVAGVQQSISQRKFMPFAGGTLTAGSQRANVGLSSLITITAGQSIAVHCSTSSNSVTWANSQMQVERKF